MSYNEYFKDDSANWAYKSEIKWMDIKKNKAPEGINILLLVKSVDDFGKVWYTVKTGIRIINNLFYTNADDVLDARDVGMPIVAWSYGLEYVKRKNKGRIFSRRVHR